jgi:hypothetical protein
MADSQNHRVQIMLDGVMIDAPLIRFTPQFHQDLIRRAKARFGSAICLCQDRTLPLVIREKSGKVFLAAWPEQASQHALDCPFHSEQRPGDNLYAPGAIERKGDITQVELSHALIHPSRHADQKPATLGPASPPPPQPRDQNAPLKESLHTWGLLHYLWEESGLSRWHPGWHRDWGFVRDQLRMVAKNTLVEGRTLIESIYIPPVWTPIKKRDIKEHWRMFCDPLLRNHRRCATVNSALVIGTVRVLEPSEFGHAIQLHHHAARFYMDQRVSDNAAKFSRRGWAAAKDLEAASEEKPYIVAAMRIEATSSGALTVVEVALMRVSPRYIPVDSSYEDRLVHVLIEQERQFIKPLHYDRHHLTLPDFVLKDVKHSDQAGDGYKTAVALYVYGPSITVQLKPKMEAADRKYAHEAGLGYWQWDVASQKEVPALPTPVARAPHVMAKAAA